MHFRDSCVDRVELAAKHLGLPVLGRYDAAARVLFSAWMLYALASGFSVVIIPILIVEIVFGAGQLLPQRSGVDDTA